MAIAIAMAIAMSLILRHTYSLAGHTETVVYQHQLYLADLS